MRNKPRHISNHQTKDDMTKNWIDPEQINEQIKQTGNAAQSEFRTYEYNFDRDGGAVGVINTGAYLPGNAWITSVRIFGISAVTSGGAATLALSVGGSTLLAATTTSTFIAGYTALNALNVRVATETELTATIAVAAVTAGRVRFEFDYRIVN